MPAAWLVLPTYNEAENMERVRRRGAAAARRGRGPEPPRAVVDDSSPDGTGEIADELAGGTTAVEVLHRAAKEGLGRAYLAGFERALAAGGATSSWRWTRTSRTTRATCRA